ncbi:MAG: outer membrane lipoprotein-sorting protein [Lentisphaeria bacterium]|jgi:outer membrane lipoprotein-sorting protein
MLSITLLKNISLIALLGISAHSLASDDAYLSYVSQEQYTILNEQQKIGLAIAIQQDQVDQGWKDSQANMEMVLINGFGDENIRSLEVKSLEIENDGDKSITVFKTPRDAKGTVFLTYSHVTKDDDQWLYLPALNRVKRINSRNKSGPFMGSEFSFEDLLSFEVLKFDYNYLEDQKLDGIDCYVVERFPKDENSGYTRIVSWIDKQHKRFMKSEYYDRKNSHLKSLIPSDFQLYLDKYWRANMLSMQNHQTGKMTQLHLSDMTLDTGLTDASFSRNSLKRAR